MENKITSLAGKVILITGGTRGIGFSTVKAFLKQGSKVALFGSRKETVDCALDELKKENPDYAVMGFHPNLTKTNEIAKVIEEVMTAWGHIDVLVNNAGISDSASVYNYKEGQFANIMDINVQSAFNMIQAVVAIMKAQGKGSIINTSSMVSIYGSMSGVAYPTSKFALNGMTKSLARELGKDNIRVNAVAPGVTNTDMVKALTVEQRTYIEAQMGMGRVGEPEEVADAFLFLASDMSSYVSGTILSVDGASLS